MSTTYYIYAEIKTNGKWVGLSPFVKTHDGKFKLMPLVWGQSAMHETYEDMIDEYSARCGLPDDLSKELSTEFHSNDEKTKDLFGKDSTWGEYYKQCVHTVDYQDAIVKKIKKDRPYKYQGYVDKTLITSFDVGEIDTLYNWLTVDEYKKLPKEEKLIYAWYEWNNWDEEYAYRYEIFQKIESLLDWYRDEATSYKSEYNYCDFIRSNVRLIIHRA